MPQESIRLHQDMDMLNIYPKIREQGQRARQQGKRRDENPYRFNGGSGKLAKQAAWTTGWMLEDKKAQK